MKRLLEKWLQNYLLKRYKSIVVFRDPSVFDKVRKIMREGRLCQAYEKAYSLCMALKSVEKISGDVAEVGAYRGGSAKLLLEVLKGKNLFVFDTFEGLPSFSRHDTNDGIAQGDFNEPFEAVKAYLSGYRNVMVYKGLFPAETGKLIRNNRFSFVHLDVDLYQGTLDSLKFFYPRMNRGGMILVHDYVNIQGVKRAVHEFFERKPEIVNVFCGTHCMIVKQ